MNELHAFPDEVMERFLLEMNKVPLEPHTVRFEAAGDEWKVRIQLVDGNPEHMIATLKKRIT